MNRSIQQIVSSRIQAATLAYVMILGPILGCADTAVENVAGESNVEVSSADVDPAKVLSPEGQDAVVSKSDDGLWQYITESTSSGLTIVSQKCSTGSQFAMDSTKAAWVWSADTTADGWGWIVDNAGDATEWASDSIGSTWTVTKNATGEFSLWVKVTAADGIAWTKTAIPASWNIVKDSAGEAWVWIGEHKVEVAVAAGVIAVVVAGLIVAPEAVGAAVVRGSVAGVSAEGTRFLTALWKDRGKAANADALKAVPKAMFLSIGQSVLKQCGAQAIGLAAG